MGKPGGDGFPNPCGRNEDVNIEVKAASGLAETVAGLNSCDALDFLVCLLWYIFLSVLLPFAFRDPQVASSCLDNPGIRVVF